jgi:DNA polymerase epsilon subunit 1
LESKGEYVDDSELIDYIGESRVIGKTIEEYGSQRSAQLTCAKRLSEYIESEIAETKGLNVKFLISKKPVNSTVTDRAIPV